MNATKTLAQFVKENKIRLRCTRTERNPYMDDAHPMNHWKVRLYQKSGATMGLYFSQGMGIHEEPDVCSVLDCLASDASGFENTGNYDDWCAEYGYEVDSRRAFRTYRAVERQAEKLEDFLGAELYQELLWQVERL